MSIEASLADKAAALTGKVKSRKSTWSPPSVTDLAEGQVLAFDQTFSKTGWCFLSNGPADGLAVLDKGYIQEPPIPDKPKFEDILQRSEWMHERIRDVMHRIDTGNVTVVHEAPILHGNRIEASLLGGFAVWMATREVFGVKPAIVENRRMLSVLVPPGERVNQKGKSHITRALMPFRDTTVGWNEHNRDALALGITYLFDKGAS